METTEYRFDDILKRYNVVLENFSTISDIYTNDKLFIKDNKLVIHPYSSTRSAVRWWNNYNREDCKIFIEDLFSEMLSIHSILISLSSTFNKKINKKKQRRKKRKNLEKQKKLLEECNKTRIGLLHLMVTYKNDENFTNFINRILGIIKKFN